MGPYSQILTNIINEKHEQPESNVDDLIFQCLLAMLKRDETIILPTHSDKNGDIFLSTLSLNFNKNKGPLLLAEISKDGQELANTLVYDQKWLVFFTDERFYKNNKGATLMYGPLNILIDQYIENRDDCLGVIVNPFHKKYSLYLTSRNLDYLIKLMSDK